MDTPHPQRKNLRIKHFDYRNPGNYFITVCINGRKNILSSIENNVPILFKIGELVETYWNEIPNHFSFVTLDAFVVMPNHVHGILTILTNDTIDIRDSWEVSKKPGLVGDSLGSIIGSWKSVCTKQARIQEFLAREDELWQRNYFERNIRDDRELLAARKYIEDNPFNWQQDPIFTA